MERNKQRAEQINLLSKFILSNVTPDEASAFANHMMRQRYKKYKILKSVFGNIYSSQKISSSRIQLFSNFPIPIAIVPKKQEESNEFQDLYSMFKNWMPGLSVDDALFILTKHGKLSEEGKKKFARFEDFGVRLLQVRSIYRRINQSLTKYMYGHDINSYALMAYYEGHPPKRSGQKPGDIDNLNYTWVCSSMTSECDSAKQTILVDDSLKDALDNAEDNSQTPDVQLSNTGQAIHRLIEYGFENLTTQPFVMREMFYLFGEKGPLYAKLAACSPPMQEKIIELLKRRYVDIAIKKWKQRKELTTAYEVVYPVRRSGYKNFHSVRTVMSQIHRSTFTSVKFDPNHVTLLNFILQELGVKTAKEYMVLKELRNGSCAPPFQVTYEHAVVLLSAAQVLNFLSFTDKLRQVPKSGLSNAISAGITDGLTEPNRAAMLYSKIIKENDFENGPRILYGVYNVDLNDAASGIAWGSIMLHSIEKFEAEIREGMYDMLKASINNGQLSFLYNGQATAIKIFSQKKR